VKLKLRSKICVLFYPTKSKRRKYVSYNREKAGGKPKREKYINKTFRNEKKKKCRNGASRKHHIKAKMRISFLQTLLNFNELCRAEFPLYFFAKCSFVEMFYFLLPMSYTGLRVSWLYGFMCEKTIATIYLFI
jgi:hypothetical protein